MRARRALDEADVVIHDRLVPGAILELARREAEIVEAGKTGFGASTPQEEINALIVDRALKGDVVVRLKAGDPGVFGRLDEEIEACEAAGIAWTIVPGLTSAAMAAARLGQSLTKRGRNTEVRFLTGHGVDGVADHDWASIARPGSVAAIYMGKRAARFIQGRLLMHGADPGTPVSVVENAGEAGGAHPRHASLGARAHAVGGGRRRAGDHLHRPRPPRRGRTAAGGGVVSKARHPKVVSANDLLEGDAVWLGPEGWVRDIRAAEVIWDEARADALLKLAERQTHRVVGAYLAEVHPDREGARPVHFREAFRTRGPSNYPHGKQAAGG